MRFDPREAGKKATYFKMIECIVPRPIAWVSSLSSDGTRNLAPFSFFTGISSAPPTLLFCAGNRRGGVPKDTPKNIQETGEFVVNVVPEAFTQKMVQTSAAHSADTDEFHFAGVDAQPSERVSVPRVMGSPIAFECTLRQIVELSDQGRVSSRIIIGNIELIHVDDSVLDEDGRIDHRKTRLVSRMGGAGYATIGELFDVPPIRL